MASIFEGAFAVPILTVLGGALDYAKNIGSGNAILASANRKNQGAQLSAQQLRVNAGQQEAASQRTAQEQQRIGELGQSRIVALAAASGGSSTDPTVMGLRARLQAEEAYRMASALYQGSERS